MASQRTVPNLPQPEIAGVPYDQGLLIISNLGFPLIRLAIKPLLSWEW